MRPCLGPLRAGWLSLSLTLVSIGCSSSDPKGPDGVPDLGSAVDGSTCVAPGSVLSGGCSGYRAAGSLGDVPSSALDEISGVVASRKNRDVLWVHNDSGGAAEVYAILVSTTAAPKLVATVSLTGAKNVDWEDVALGPSPLGAGDFLYVGDIGDNITSSKRRSSIQIYRVPEPILDTSQVDQRLSIGAAQVERIELVYPEGKPYDSEALFVDPQGGEIFLISKNLAGPSYLYSAGAVAAPPASPITLRPLLGCDGTPRPLSFTGGSPIVTGADIAPSGRGILVRAYSGVFLWERGDSESVADAFTKTACQLPSANEQQGEAVSFSADGRGYYTIGEGKNEPVHFFKKD